MSEQPYRISKLTRRTSDGGTYWSYCISFGEPRQRYSLGTTDLVAAGSLARDYWAKRTVGSADTVGDIMRSYLSSIQDTPSHERKGNAWKAAKPYWGGLRMHQIDLGTSSGYTLWRQHALNTRRYELALVRTALLWAKAKGLIAHAPIVTVPPMPDSETGYLTKDEFRKFLAGCHAPHVQLFAQLAVTTGARCAALLELPWVRVDLERRQINLNPVGRIQPDNKRRAIVPVTDRLLPLLVAAKDGAMSPFVIEVRGGRIASIKKGIRLASLRSGVHCTPHMFRHSAAVWMAEARVPMSEIAAYLGHKNVLITSRIYARYNPEFLREAAKALDWG